MQGLVTIHNILKGPLESNGAIATYSALQLIPPLLNLFERLSKSQSDTDLR